MSGRAPKKKSSKARQIIVGSFAFATGSGYWMQLCNNSLTAWDKITAKNVAVRIQWWIYVFASIMPEFMKKKDQAWKDLGELIKAEPEMLKVYKRLKKCFMLFQVEHFAKMSAACNKLINEYKKDHEDEYDQFVIATFYKRQDAKQLWADMGLPDDECYMFETACIRINTTVQHVKVLQELHKARTSTYH
jgi:hypothetical protein